MKRAIYLFALGLVIILASIWIGSYCRHATNGTWMLMPVDFTMFSGVMVGLVIAVAIAPKCLLDAEMAKLDNKS